MKSLKYLVLILALGFISSCENDTTDDNTIPTTEDTTVTTIDTSVVLEEPEIVEYCYYKADSLKKTINSQLDIHYKTIRELKSKGLVDTNQYQDVTFGLEKLKGQNQVVTFFMKSQANNCVPVNLVDSLYKRAYKDYLIAENVFLTEKTLEAHKNFEKAKARRLMYCEIFKGICKKQV